MSGKESLRDARIAAADNGSNLRLWASVHRWSSLVCTAFLLAVCLTGLPLIFHEEIRHWVNPTPNAQVAPDAPRVDLDRLIARSRALYPGQIVTGTFVDDDEPQVIVYLAASWAELQSHSASRPFVRFDAHTGRVLERSEPADKDGITLLDLMLRIHIALFACPESCS